MASLLSLVVSFSQAQNDPFVITEPVLLSVENEVVTVHQFWKVYSKNNVTAKAIDPKTVEEYLELFINFKLKVKEAEALGYDTISSLQRELSGYRRQLAAPYLTDQKITDDLVREAGNRLLEEVNALHVLLRFDSDASPADTLKFYRKIKSLRGRINSLKDFQRTMNAFTQDKDENTIGEDLGYFSAFDMVYPFESAAYSTEVGKVSEPVRTRFGYHLIFVKDRRPARGSIRVAHIMARSNDKSTVEEARSAELKINEIYKKLEAGESFEELAKEFSDDRGTAKSGGVLPWFGTGRMEQSFEEAAFSLENDGDFSKPIKTNYGWHIIKRLEKREAGDNNNDPKTLKRRVERDRRGVKSKQSFIKRMKEFYNFQEYPKGLAAVRLKIDEDYFDRKWKAEEKASGMNAVLFSVEDPKMIPEKKEFTQMDFARFLEKNKKFQRRPATPIETIVASQYNAWVNEEITNFEDARLEIRYPEFGDLMKEYRDGILLFELMNDKVWNKAVEDTTGLKAFYQANKDKFMWPDRVRAVVFSCSSEALANQAGKLLKKAAKKGMTYEDIQKQLNGASQLDVNFKSGTFRKGENAQVDGVEWKEGIVGPLKKGDRFVIVKIEEFLPSQAKKLSEARGLITAAYQDELEKKWLEELRAKYSFKVSQEALRTLKKKYKQE